MKVLIEIDDKWIDIRNSSSEWNKVICSLNREQIDAIFEHFTEYSNITTSSSDGLSIISAIEYLIDLNLIKHKRVVYCNICGTETEDWKSVVSERKHKCKSLC